MTRKTHADDVTLMESNKIQIAQLLNRMDEYLADPTVVRFPFKLDYAEVDLVRRAITPDHGAATETHGDSA